MIEMNLNTSSRLLQDFELLPLPSNPLTSNAKAESFVGVGANGHSQSRNVPPIPCLMFCSIPISYGNSCLETFTLVPSGPSRYPPNALARRTSVLCLSISQPSMVVTLAPKHHTLRTKRSPITKSAKQFAANKTKKTIICVTLGPRYCIVESQPTLM